MAKQAEVLATRKLSRPGVHHALSGCALVLHTADVLEVVPLTEGRHVTVGRCAPADVVLPDASLSRQHARFLLLDDGILLEDLGSTNGTYVEGRPVQIATLQHGQRVILGAVNATVEVLGGSLWPGVLSHADFMLVLDHELQRARYGQRRMAAMLARSASRTPVHRWLDRLAKQLRVIDRIGLHGDSMVEILFPDVGDEHVRELTAAWVDACSEFDLRCGVAVFPSVTTSARGLISACSRAAEEASSDRPLVVASSELDEQPAGGLVAESDAMKALLRTARRVAASDLPVLLQGETGSGKEVVARYLHDSSERAAKPFLAVNCGALPHQLIESTLFGHVKGAFTGAVSNHAGIFEAANGGTVLLDEVAELPLAAQVALLRTLENSEVVRVGSTAPTRTDVRIIAASNRDLEQMVSAGDFREDLLYRLNAMTLRIPPLRERRADIAPLADWFLLRPGTARGEGAIRLAPGAADALLAYRWPGNVRELRNVVERAAVLREHDCIELTDLPVGLRPDGATPQTPGVADTSGSALANLRLNGESFRAFIERVEVAVLEDALEAADGNQSQAARDLNMPRRTLIHKIRAFALQPRSRDVEPER